MIIFSSINQKYISFYYDKKISIGGIHNYNLSHPSKCFSDDYNTTVYNKIYNTLTNKNAKYNLYTINHYAIQKKGKDKIINNTIDNPYQQPRNKYPNINYNRYSPKPNSGIIDELDKPKKGLCGDIKQIYGHTNSMIFIIQKLKDGLIKLIDDGIKIQGKKMTVSEFKLNTSDMNKYYPLEKKDYGLDSTLSYYKGTSKSKKASLCLKNECFRNEIINNKTRFHKGESYFNDPDNQIVGYIVFITFEGIQYQNLIKSYMIHDYIMYKSLDYNLIGGVKPSGHFEKEDNGKKDIKKSTNDLKNPHNDIWKLKPRYNLRSTTTDPKTGDKISRIKLYENITKSSSYPFTAEKTQFLKKAKQELKRINFYDYNMETMKDEEMNDKKDDEIKDEEISEDEIINNEGIYDAIYLTSKQDFFNVLSVMLLNDRTQKTKYSPFDIDFYKIEGNIINKFIDFIELIKNKDQEFNMIILNNYYIFVDLQQNVNDVIERYETLKAYYSELTKIYNYIQQNEKLRPVYGVNYEQQKIIIFFYNFIKDLINDYNAEVEINSLYKMFLYLMIYYYCYYFYLIMISNEGLININGITYIKKIFSINPEFVINLLYYCLYSYIKNVLIPQKINPQEILGMFNDHSTIFLNIIGNNESVIMPPN